ncbi:MAG: DsrE family protein [Bacteroidota bacterium]|nr:DsrE family protein [Bacteroidota bacterium]
MKKQFVFLAILTVVFTSSIYAKSSKEPKEQPTTIGMVIYSNDTETVWNALRLANYSKNQGDTVSIFLLGKGVELDSMVKTDKDMEEQADKFLENGGVILGCGTCLQSRKNDEPEVCKYSSLADLYELIRKNKIVITF